MPTDKHTDEAATARAFKFTDRAVAEFLRDAPDDFTVSDTELVGFKVRRQRGGTPRFYFERRVNGRKFNTPLAPVGEMPAAAARIRALALLVAWREGRDPVAELKKAEKDRLAARGGMTLREAIEEHCTEAKVRPGTRTAYLQDVGGALAHLAEHPVSAWSDDTVAEVVRRHEGYSAATLAGALRTMRCAFNFWRRTTSAQIPNPVNMRKHAPPEPRRRTFLRQGQFAEFFEELKRRRPNPGADLVEVLALTGLRFQELAQMTWPEVDFAADTFCISADRMKGRQPLLRPLTRRLREILLDRKASARRGQAWVFPANRGDGPVQNVRSLMTNAGATAGVGPHALRRTWTGIARGLQVDPLILKEALGHAAKSDRTAHYTVGVEHLLPPLQAIEDVILGIAPQPVTPAGSPLDISQLSADQRAELLQRLLADKAAA